MSICLYTDFSYREMLCFYFFRPVIGQLHVHDSREVSVSTTNCQQRASNKGFVYPKESHHDITTNNTILREFKPLFVLEVYCE